MPITVAAHLKPAPIDILEMVKCGCHSDEACSANKCGHCTAQLSCTEFCACQQIDSVTCHSRWTKTSAEFVDDDNDDGEDEDEET